MDTKMDIDWLKECSQPNDENTKMFSDFESLKIRLQIPKENFEYLWPEKSDSAALRIGCFVYHLIENIDLRNINILMWISSEMETYNGGPWMKKKYQENEGLTFSSVRQIAQHLSIPCENVLFLLPDDDQAKSRIAEYVSDFLVQFKCTNYTAMAWFSCREHYSTGLLRRML